jgi:two-component system sensor histidine kinase/response regulator
VLRILYADDSALGQRMTGELLRRAGHQVDLARTGTEAVALADAHAYDVVLMDLEMPEMDGLTASARIRETHQGTGRHVPIVAVTGHNTPYDRARCSAAGLDGYLAKPFTAAELMTAIASALGRLPDPPRITGTPITPELRALLIAEYETKRRLIDAAMATNRFDAVSLLAHELKSAMAVVHAGAPYQSADALERAAADSNAETLAEAWAALTTHLERLVAALRQP